MDNGGETKDQEQTLPSKTHSRNLCIPAESHSLNFALYPKIKSTAGNQEFNT